MKYIDKITQLKKHYAAINDLSQLNIDLDVANRFTVNTTDVSSMLRVQIIYTRILQILDEETLREETKSFCNNTGYCESQDGTKNYCLSDADCYFKQK